jgi:glyoxylase-like metal-dependent hydrolase (beta-lactamase superfamily II)
MTVKQEQQEARTTVDEIAPGALRMQLPIAIPGLRHVNMYCFPDADGATVVDPGLPDAATWAVIQQRLRDADLEVRHVHTVLVTHSHPDHFGGAARFHAEAGSRIIVHEDFSVFGERARQTHLEVSVENLHAPRAVEHDSTTATAERLAGGFRIPWGGDAPTPGDRDRAEWERIRASATSGMVPPVTHVVSQGDVVKLGGRDFSVVHSPGHTADHICFYDREAGTLLAGDHILPSITPHISGLGVSRDPLQAFYDSLDKILELGPLGRCLPAHGDVFDDVAARVAAIKRHHDQRLTKLLEISKRLGPSTVPQLSEALFPQRAWGIMAQSETFAHLEHLRLLRRIEGERRGDGTMLYVA